MEIQKQTKGPAPVQMIPVAKGTIPHMVAAGTKKQPDYIQKVIKNG